MSNDESRDAAFSSLGFTRQFLLPALLIFLVPTASLLFFQYAQSSLDAEVRAVWLAQLSDDDSLTDEERIEMRLLVESTPISRLFRDPEFAATLSEELQFHYGWFRLLINASWASILASVGTFVLVGVGVFFSVRSQRVQYLCLSLGWHVLRIFGAAQTLVQGALLVALSFWVTAILFERYVPRLIFWVAIAALYAAYVLIRAIFRKPEIDFEVAGEIIDSQTDAPLWSELRKVCDRVGTEPPDFIVAGIDDNFFVTEQPVTVGDKVVTGRTLFVSLSLMKQLNGDEADAVMAHEMAHFSGEDTLFSRKITPLLARYGAYLGALSEGIVARPIFYFMLCFRGLFELSLGRLNRQREFRADRIAAEATSPDVMASALLRIVAYSSYRHSVEKTLFEQEEVLEQADILNRIEEGFHEYARGFPQHPDAERLTTSHPFDSHPPLEERLAAQGRSLHSGFAVEALSSPGDGRWYFKLPSSEQREREQWDAYEQKFRDVHELELALRYEPATPEQQEVVERHFPEVVVHGDDEKLTIDFRGIVSTAWEDPVRFSEVKQFVVTDKSVLNVVFQRDGDLMHKIPLKQFSDEEHGKLSDAVNRYYGRFLASREYRNRPQDEDVAG